MLQVNGQLIIQAAVIALQVMHVITIPKQHAQQAHIQQAALHLVQPVQVAVHVLLLMVNVQVVIKDIGNQAHLV